MPCRYSNQPMAVQHISAVTLAVREMVRSVAFYQRLGFDLVYGGPNAEFSSLRIGNVFVNLQVQPGVMLQWWGRVIFRVDEVDAYHDGLEKAGLFADLPKDAPWGERYFHITDPDGHELSFAQLISP